MATPVEISRAGATCGRGAEGELAILGAVLVRALEQALTAARALPAEWAQADTALPCPTPCSDLSWTTGHLATVDQPLTVARIAFARLGAALACAHADTLAAPLAAAGPRPRILTTTDSTADTAPHALSPREAEVLGLLARGRSNREIATALRLSPRTVQRHVANAYLKIGAHNKADATTFSLTHHLA